MNTRLKYQLLYLISDPKHATKTLLSTTNERAKDNMCMCIKLLEKLDLSYEVDVYQKRIKTDLTTIYFNYFNSELNGQKIDTVYIFED